MLAPHSRVRWPLVAALTVVLAVAFLVIYLFDLAAVPFHPDESGYLYMSRDFSILFLDRNPLALAWSPTQPLTLETQKRLLDAPLTRYMVGLGWWLRGYTTADLNADWAWGAPWEANLAAIPPPALLLAARTPIAVLGALSAVLLFWIGVDIGGIALGLPAALLLALDPLLLLHARRAMAESLLTFFSLLAIWGVLRLVRACDAPSANGLKLLAGSVGVGVLLGLAMSAKQTELALLPVALLITALALMQRHELLGRRLKTATLTAFAVVAASALTFWLLNPVLLTDPWAVARQMIAARAELAAAQIAVNGAADPGLVLADPPVRVAAAAVQLYWQMPSFWDVPVYLDQLQPPAQRYLAVAWHTFLREAPAGILIIAFSVLGVAASVARLARQGLGAATRAEQLLWLWTLLTLALLAVSIPLNWQRYFMPLLPASRLFAAMGIVVAVRFVALRWKLPATFPRAWWSIDRA
jgi:4-amino-4-deoxy-L-arabinose transferase-like glycosyltransferase